MATGALAASAAAISNVTVPVDSDSLAFNTIFSALQGAPRPAARENSHLFDRKSVLCTFFLA